MSTARPADPAVLSRLVSMLLDEDIELDEIAQVLLSTPDQLAEWSSLPRLRALLDTLREIYRLRFELLAARARTAAIAALERIVRSDQPSHADELSRRAAVAILKLAKPDRPDNPDTPDTPDTPRRPPPPPSPHSPPSSPSPSCGAGTPPASSHLSPPLASPPETDPPPAAYPPSSFSRLLTSHLHRPAILGHSLLPTRCTAPARSAKTAPASSDRPPGRGTLAHRGDA